VKRRRGQPRHLPVRLVHPFMHSEQLALRQRRNYLWYGGAYVLCGVLGWLITGYWWMLLIWWGTAPVWLVMAHRMTDRANRLRDAGLKMMKWDTEADRDLRRWMGEP